LIFPVQPVSQQLARLEERHVFLFDMHGLARARIAPDLASRFFTENAPKPRSSTRSPRAMASVTSSNTVFTIRSTSRWYRCGFSSAIF
jgi:hypothetical protein